MAMFRAGLAVAMVLIGGAAALLGLVLLASAIKTGTIMMTHGTGGAMVTETVTYAADQGRFLRLAGLLGAAPLVLGALAAIWGLRTLRH